MGGRVVAAPLAVIAAFLVFGVALLPSATASTPARLLGTDIPPGHITSSQTWTPAGSPYRILGTIIIDSGVIVRAQPGTVVSPLSNVRIFVDGALMLEGDAASHVRVNTTGASWDGIQYNASAAKSWANFTDLKDASTGIN
ncbi:MAG TPA: hypothetical protein VI893_05770, partial [Thermoplasmata archaeon]|nr:hypothetical protein [Thermoplasmata archaeon]